MLTCVVYFACIYLLILLTWACYATQNAQNPVEDFRHTPPGILALSNMMYFAKNYRENYTKVNDIDLVMYPYSFQTETVQVIKIEVVRYTCIVYSVISL